MKIKKNLAILGLGLLGTSLALALKKNSAWHIMGYARNAETRNWVSENGIVDEIYDTPEAILKKADLAVLCMPVSAAVKMLPLCAENLPPSAVITDIGSVKMEIIDAAAEFPQMHFVGSHPMAGTEKSGCKAAFAGLYQNADVFVVPGRNSTPDDAELCRRMWLDAGCARAEEIDAVRHDELVADTSHVLHLLASALTLSILDAPDAEEQRKHFAGCATGFRDTTRIASSNPAMWRGIMESNRDAVLAAVKRFEKRFIEMKKTIENGDFDSFEELFSTGKLLRNAWLGYKRPRPARLLLCGIKHCGKSSTGKILAELLPAQFADSDDEIVRLYKERTSKSLTVRQLYRQLGEEDFRKLERDALAQLAERQGAMAVSLGGGALSNPFVTDELLHKLGEVIWLDIPDNIAWERVKANGIPPFLANADDPEAEFYRTNTARKEVFARCAKWVIQPEPGDTPQRVALRILGALD